MVAQIEQHYAVLAELDKRGRGIVHSNCENAPIPDVGSTSVVFNSSSEGFCEPNQYTKAISSTDHSNNAACNYIILASIASAPTKG